MTLQDYQIDKRVKESFGDYRVTPPTSVWNRLEQSIGSRKRARTVMMRRRFLAAAAVILAFVTGYLAAVLYAPRQDLPVSGHDQLLAGNQVESPLHGTGSDPGLLTIDPGETQGTSLKVPTGRNSLLQASREPRRVTATAVPVPHTILPAELAASWFMEEVTITFTDHPYLVTILPPQQNFILPRDVAPEKSRNLNSSNRFAIAGLAGQTYTNYYLANNYQHFDNIQPAEVYQHDIIASSQELVTRPSVSYGVVMDFGLTQRIALSTGLSMHRFSAPLTYGSGEFALLSTSKPVYNQFGVVLFNDNMRNEMAKSPLMSVNTGEFVQNFSYAEVPLTSVYSVIDRKIAIDVRAGIGANFLTSNKVMLVTNEERTEIGRTEGMRHFYMSGLAGVDISMPFGKHWQASFTPVYRHALQGVSEQEIPRAHFVSFGLYSGIRYRF
jgi:hypothetical protein